MKSALVKAGRIYLVGYRGVGKSTVAPLLAERLGWESKDTDDAIIQASGRSIAEIFADPGEAGFRVLETAVLTQVSTVANQVIATGGGIVLVSDNRALIVNTGVAIWLRAPANILYERIQLDAGTSVRRPHLVAGGSLNEVEALLAVREPHYKAVGRIVVDTAERSPDEVVSAILASC